MSWNTIYPVLTDEALDEYEARATPAERARMEEWFGIEAVVNPSPAAHIASVSLFWKNVDIDQPDLPVPTEEIMRNAGREGLVSRHAPWDHYVRPLLSGAASLRKELPEVRVRVYLANDLGWLTDRLVEAGCEVRRMKCSSLRHMPGALWRFLAMEDAPDLVSILDADNLDSRRDLVRRADCLRTCDLPTWRRPNANVPEVDHAGWFVYRSMIAWPLATRVRLPIRRLLEAFVWHSLRGDIPSVLEYPGKGRIPYFGTRWPGYGFDEWFLSVALYPRLAARGMLTDVSATSPGYAFPLDLEYAAWANPLSETASPVRMVEPTHSGSHSARRRMLQFGTSGNVLEGWENFDWPEVDITRPLPFPDACARFMFLEHVIEHVTAREAWDFFAECRRVLEPGGILRLAFPDMVQIFRSAAPCYHEFIRDRGWGDGTPASSLKAVLFEHGHQAGWTSEAMAVVLEAQGFHTSRRAVGDSPVPELRNIERHGRAVGEEVNAAETAVLEAVNRNPAASTPSRRDWGLPDDG